jgi:hypothetical protein
MIEPSRFSGSPQDVGFARAQVLAALPMPAVTADELAFAKDCKNVASDLNPDLIRVYDGFLEGGGWDADRFLVYFFARRQGLLRGCTNFAVLPEACAGDETLVGRNYDWAYSDLAFCEARSIEMAGSFPFVSYTHHWIGHPDCLNSQGLFVAISSLPRSEAKQPGIQWNLLVDAIAMTCSSVDEAVDLLTTWPHLRSITYLVADRKSAAAVEATDSDTVVREPVDGVVAATNHVYGRSDESDRTRHSVARYDRARERLLGNAPDIDRIDVVDVLKDPVCTIREGRRFLHPLDHVPLAAMENWGTIWSTFCRPGQKQIEIAQGHPQDVPYIAIDW